MATQTVTVSRTPANGGSQSSGVPASPGATDYSLTDLDLLESPDVAAEETAADADGGRTHGSAPTAPGQNGSNASGKGTAQTEENREAEVADQKGPQDTAEKAAPGEFERAFELPGVGPKLREICERETAYRELFPTVAEARGVREVFTNADAARAAASAQAQLARLDSLVESRDPRAHAELLADLQQLAPEAFRGLALTFAERLATLDPEAHQQVSAAMAAQALASQRWPEHVALLGRAVDQQDWPAVKFLVGTLSSQLEQWSGAVRTNWGRPPATASFGNVQRETEGRRDAGATASNQFLEAVNTDVEHAVRQSVGRKVEELLPDAPEGARQKIAGEIFRELDQALRQDPELLEQVRESVRDALTGARNLQLGADGRGAPAARESVARLISSRARAALPGVARRVVADWTESVLRSSQARRSRQSESASRVEVGRGGSPAPVPLRPRGVDYTRMSDEEILNMD